MAIHKILRATAIIGGASVISLALTALRFKLIAVSYGLEGMGIASVMYSLLFFGGSLFSLGVGNVAAKYVAIANSEGENQLSQLYQSLMFVIKILVALTIVFFICSKNLIASLAYGNSSYAWLIFLTSLAIAAQIISANQQAYLNGVGKYKQTAQVVLLAAVFSTVVSVTLLLEFKYLGILASVLLAPMVAAIMGSWKIKALRRGIITYKIKPIDKLKNASPTLQMGIVSCVSMVLISGAHFFLILFVRHKLGLNVVGIFQAAWNVGSAYLLFFLSSLMSEYLARISVVSKEKITLNQAVFDQTKAALLICSPVSIMMMAFAPLVVYALYSTAFESAVDIIRWYVLGDVFKILSWCLSLMLLARGAKLKYISVDIVATVVYFSLSLLLLNYMDITAIGVSYALSSFLAFIVILILSNRETGFSLDMRVVRLMVYLLISLVAIYEISIHFNQWYCYIVGCIICSFFVVNLFSKKHVLSP